MVVPIHRILNINGKEYKQIVTDDIKRGDLLLDTFDHSVDICASVSDNYLSMGSGFVEIGISKTRVRKLIPNHSNIC